RAKLLALPRRSQSRSRVLPGLSWFSDANLWTNAAVDKLRLRLLLANSILPLGLCMMGLLLVTIKPMPQGIWRWCSAIGFVVCLVFVVTVSRTFRRLGVRKIQREGWSTFMLYLFGALGTVAMLLQVYNLALPPARSGRFSPGLFTNLSLQWPSLPA